MKKMRRPMRTSKVTDKNLQKSRKKNGQKINNMYRYLTSDF